MSEKHTSGPWQFYADVPSTDPNWHIVTNASRMRVLANVHIEPGNEMDLANARLIAAAPDLLAALKECDEAMAYMSEYDIPILLPERVKTAIAKATGEHT